MGTLEELFAGHDLFDLTALDPSDSTAANGAEVAEYERVGLLSHTELLFADESLRPEVEAAFPNTPTYADKVARYAEREALALTAPTQLHAAMANPTNRQLLLDFYGLPSNSEAGDVKNKAQERAQYMRGLEFMRQYGVDVLTAVEMVLFEENAKRRGMTPPNGSDPRLIWGAWLKARTIGV